MHRSAGIRNHVWELFPVMPALGFSFRLSAALEIHPCRPLVALDRMGVYKRPGPFPYWPRSFHFLQVELPNPFAATV